MNEVKQLRTEYKNDCIDGFVDIDITTGQIILTYCVDYKNGITIETMNLNEWFAKHLDKFVRIEVEF